MKHSPLPPSACSNPTRFGFMLRLFLVRVKLARALTRPVIKWHCGSGIVGTQSLMKL